MDEYGWRTVLRSSPEHAQLHLAHWHSKPILGFFVVEMKELMDDRVACLFHRTSNSLDWDWLPGEPTDENGNPIESEPD